jgi:hypothetical protein
MGRWSVIWRIGLCGLATGLVINAVEWIAHRWLLDARWRVAFHALGREPVGWGTFIPANFWLGILAISGYRWATRRYGPGSRTALRVSIAVWLVFWVIPTAALQPLHLFPGSLLGLIMLVGLLDAPVGTLVGAWLFDRVAARRHETDRTP